jgi:hypothetical protein
MMLHPFVKAKVSTGYFSAYRALIFFLALESQTPSQITPAIFYAQKRQAEFGFQLDLVDEA